MKGDLFGRPLATGDLVVIRVRGMRALQLARVVRCTKKRIVVTTIKWDETKDAAVISGWEQQVAMAVFVLKVSEATPEVIKLLAKRAAENEK